MKKPLIKRTKKKHNLKRDQPSRKKSRKKKQRKKKQRKKKFLTSMDLYTHDLPLGCDVWIGSGRRRRGYIW